MKTNTNEPLRGHPRRSRAYQEHLLRQTPERRAELDAGELAYNGLADAEHGARQAAERDFAEGMLGLPAVPGPAPALLERGLTVTTTP